MTKNITLRHEFVEHIPADLREGTLYVSIPFATAVHRCCCGCGKEVVTPLTPTDWSLTFDGETVSLDPSIGNWNWPCQSHYWITNSRVRWAPRWSRQQIRAGVRLDLRAKERHFANMDSTTPDVPAAAPQTTARQSLWQRLAKKWF